MRNLIFKNLIQRDVGWDRGIWGNAAFHVIAIWVVSQKRNS